MLEMQNSSSYVCISYGKYYSIVYYFSYENI